jgi:hypothetical protein
MRAPPSVRSTARLTILFLGLLLMLGMPLLPAAAQPWRQDTDTPVPTDTSAPTNTSEPTNTPNGFSQPTIVLTTYTVPGGAAEPGKSFDLEFRLANQGGSKARNLVITTVASDFVPKGNGGVIAGGAMSAGADTGYTQGLTARADLAAGSVTTIEIVVDYTDSLGEAYQRTFTLGVKVKGADTSTSYKPTSTTTPAARPVLLVTGYSTVPATLRAGHQFDLSLQIENRGGATARHVGLILGGGTQTQSGTPEAGGSSGLSGASGDFTNFAPVGTSNISALGDILPGAMKTAVVKLIVNSTTNPGAYTLKMSFVCNDDSGAEFNVDQVITLLVYQPPIVEVSYYQPLEAFFVGQPGTLPIQVVNLDRKSSLLGRMEVTSLTGEMSNNVSPVGYLDPGMFYTLDVLFTPFEAGQQPIDVRIDYQDDFNQLQSLTQTLEVEVLDEPGLTEGEGGFVEGETGLLPPALEPETFWQKLWRGLLGLLGLDSAPPQPELPGELMLPEPEAPPVRVPKG